MYLHIDGGMKGFIVDLGAPWRPRRVELGHRGMSTVEIEMHCNRIRIEDELNAQGTTSCLTDLDCLEEAILPSEV